MGENEIKQKMESNTSFLNETKALAISTEDAKEIHELMKKSGLLCGLV